MPERAPTSLTGSFSRSLIISTGSVAFSLHGRSSRSSALLSHADLCLLQHSWKEVSTTLWMYDSEPGISDILRDVLAFRYRLAPTFYSLYVSHYQRHGWPILKACPIFQGSVARSTELSFFAASPLAPLGGPCDTATRRGVPLRLSYSRRACHRKGSDDPLHILALYRKRRRYAAPVVRTRHGNLARCSRRLCHPR